MTAIAWDGNILAVDSGCFAGSTIQAELQKLFKLKDGSYLALCGDMLAAPKIIKFFNGEGYSKSDFKGDDFKGLIVSPHGKRCWVFDEDYMDPAEIYGKAALGAGEESTMAALNCGVNSIRAIEISALTNVYVKTPVQYVSFIDGVAVPYKLKNHPWSANW